MGLKHKLKTEEYSEARKEAMQEIENKKINEDVKMEKQEKSKKQKTLDIIKNTLGDKKMSRKELKEISGLTLGQIAGCIYKSNKNNDALKFKNGVFYVE